ncbi:MAG: anti-sigma 24 factor [Rhodocyclaceae bacterium]|nr:anti-sigma 24 factor [Rhodocyclaceae bacterium]
MNERISALFDGQADGQAQDAIVDALNQAPDQRDRWRRYCLIGDALRDEPALDIDMTAAVMERLEHEPTVLAPVTRTVAPDARGMWQRVLPLAASVMGVAVVGWLALQVDTQKSGGQAPQIAAQPATQLATAQAPVPVADSGSEALRAYVFAHQSTAQQGAVPGVAPYVRTVAQVARGQQ